MKYLFWGLIGMMFLSTCTTDFVLEGDWDEVPIVYGFINATDTAHYIRVEKAFLEPGGDASQIAQIPDSLYFGEDVDVFLENNTNGQRFLLTRVDGNLDGYPRETGVFAEAPNYLYKVRGDMLNLSGDESLSLVVKRGEEELTSGQTTILSQVSPTETQPSNPLRLKRYNNTISISWRMGVEAKVFDVRLRINYKERRAGGEFEDKSVMFPVSSRVENDQDKISENTSFRSEAFYQFLGGALEKDPSIVRKELTVDVVVQGGGKEFLDFLDIYDANLGITSANQIPVYTNMSKGLGIFSSTSHGERKGLTLDLESQDSLRLGIYTQALNFQ